MWDKMQAGGFQVLGVGEMEMLEKELARKAILGDEAFIERVKAQASQQAAAPEKQPAEAGYPVFVTAGTWAIILLSMLTIYLYTRQSGLKALFGRELAAKDKEINSRLAAERARIYKDLDEKYRADIVSFEAMSQRLEIEKNKVRELEAKLR
jgi:hypothetical protein